MSMWFCKDYGAKKALFTQRLHMYMYTTCTLNSQESDLHFNVHVPLSQADLRAGLGLGSNGGNENTEFQGEAAKIRSVPHVDSSEAK
jgi:hypothetical protein